MSFSGQRHGGGKEIDDNWRLRLLSLVFIAVALILIGRLFDLQVLKGGAYAAIAADQQELYQKLFPERGSIYVAEESNGQQVLFPLVTNTMLYLVYAAPREMGDATATANQLFDILGLPQEGDRDYQAAPATSTVEALSSSSTAEMLKYQLISKWIAAFNNKDKNYVPLRDRVSVEQADKITALGLKGIGMTEKSYRYYPEKNIGGHIFGFWGFSGDERVGKYGLEGYYDDLLAGQMGEIKSERDALGNMIALGNSEFKEKVDGSDLVLTINRPLQYVACASLQKSIADHKAKSGSVIVVDPSTGAILAMCSYPDYDPDKYYQVKDASVFNNQAIFGSYEPGSTFKTITMAAAIDRGAVTPDTTYDDTGVVDYGKYKIRNFEDKSYGICSMTKVLQYSLNTGAIYAMQRMTPKVFVDYVKKFNFGQPTGIELKTEASGNISNLSKKGEINQATATFGQGISVTPIQLIMAFSSIINGGKLMKPYIVSQIIRDNQVVKQTKPEIVKQTIKPETSTIMKGMLVSVVENGHAAKAKNPFYRVGGKTGTAQVPGPHGGYMSDDNIIGSFTGFAPFADPKVAVLVRVDLPMEGRLGETVAVPVFNDIVNFAMQYYHIPHDK